jgi:hypothetical protein
MRASRAELCRSWLWFEDANKTARRGAPASGAEVPTYSNAKRLLARAHALRQFE